MAYTYTDVGSLNEYLESRSYISGAQASEDDVKVFFAVGSKPESDTYPNAARWWDHISALLLESFPGEPEGVVLPTGGAAGASKGSPEFPSAALYDVNPKVMKKVVKEGGKKAQDIIGMADMGGLKFFCTFIETAEGDLRLLDVSMDAMNVEVEPDSEERKGGSGEIGKVLISQSEEQVAVVSYVPADKQDKVKANEWMAEIMKVTKGEVMGEGNAFKAFGIIKGDKEAGRFPIKLKDEALATAIKYLKDRDCFPEDEDEDEDFECYGDDAFDQFE